MIVNYKYYNRDFLELYFEGSPNLLEVQDEEKHALTRMFNSIGLESMDDITHLDVGTCTGRYLKWAFDKGCRSIYGLDKSIDSISFCEEFVPFPVNLLHGCCSNEDLYEDIQHIDSCSVMLGTICHLDDPQLTNFAKNLERKMDTGSIVAISSWNRPPVGLGIYNERDALDLYERSRLFNYTPFRARGFKLLHMEYTRYLTIRMFIKG